MISKAGDFLNYKSTHHTGGKKQKKLIILKLNFGKTKDLTK